MIASDENAWTSAQIELRFNQLSNAGYNYWGSRDALVALGEWFGKTTQDHWLYFLRNYDWGMGELPLAFMIESERCDFAVAKSIFWMAEFDSYLRDYDTWQSSKNTSPGRLLSRISEREITANFPRSGKQCLYWMDRERQKWFKDEYLVRIQEGFPVIPESLLDESDFPLADDPERFASLALGDRISFMELGAGFAY